MADTMLEGHRISLRPVREADLDRLYDAHTAIGARGAYFPLGVMSESAFRREFAEHGFWQKTEGMLVIVSPDGEIAGHIEFFRPVSYWDAFELSYQLYEDRHAGQGYVTEAVQLLVGLPVRDEEGAPHPPCDRARERRVAADRGEMRVHAGRDGPRRVLQRWPQPGRAALLAAADRSPPVEGAGGPLTGLISKLQAASSEKFRLAMWGRSAGLPSAQRPAPNLRPTPLVRTPEPASRYEVRGKIAEWWGASYSPRRKRASSFHHCSSCWASPSRLVATATRGTPS